MNKNYKVITINGVRGIFAAVFVVLGLIAGFVISPGWVCMKLWNRFFQDTFVLMNIFEGIMLWAIIALSLYALNNKRTLIGFGAYPALSKEQIRDIMTKAKLSEAKIMRDLEKIKQDEIPSEINDKESEKEEVIS